MLIRHRYSHGGLGGLGGPHSALTSSNFHCHNQFAYNFAHSCPGNLGYSQIFLTKIFEQTVSKAVENQEAGSNALPVSKKGQLAREIPVNKIGIGPRDNAGPGITIESQ